MNETDPGGRPISMYLRPPAEDDAEGFVVEQLPVSRKRRLCRRKFLGPVYFSTVIGQHHHEIDRIGKTQRMPKVLGKGQALFTSRDRLIGVSKMPQGVPAV